MLIVRRLKVSDLPALEQLEAERWQSVSGRAGWLAGFQKLFERTVAEEPEGLMVAERNGQVVGAAIARTRGRHPLSGLVDGQIFHLSVAPGERRRGVTERLLRECEAYLRSRGCEVAHLSLPADATGDAELLLKSGYRVAAWELERPLK